MDGGILKRVSHYQLSIEGGYPVTPVFHPRLYNLVRETLG